jgi:uncharacterized membrane protein YozB (DUF420 family)
MNPQPTEQRARRRSWPVPASLIALSLAPLTAGALRLVQLAGGPPLMPADHRFSGFPGALVAHLIGATVFALAGALQFVPRLRRRGWHRRSGRVLVIAGLVVVGSALWVTLFYEAQPGTGDVLYATRLVVAPGMAACLVLGFTAIRRRDIAAHRAWMVRAYALGLGAGTQVFTEGFGGAVFGNGVLEGDLAKAAAWAVNLAVAEWVIRCPEIRRRRRARLAARHLDVPIAQQASDSAAVAA